MKPIQYHLLNVIHIWSPRWHDRVILPSVKKFKPGYNIIVTTHHNYPGPYLMSSTEAATYPQETKHATTVFGTVDYQVYVIPLADLKTVQEHEAENQEIKETANSIFS